MDSQRPKIGLLLLTAEWFAQIGAREGVFSQLPGLLESDAVRINRALGVRLDVVYPGILSTRQQVTQAVKHFEQEGVDGVVAGYITWGEDQLIIELLQQMPSTPLLLWCYAPFRRLPVTFKP